MGWVVPVVQLATAAYGAYSQKRAGDKAMKAQKGLLAERMKQAQDAEWYRKQGRDAMSQSMRYYGGLLSGNRQRMTEVLQPELNQINQGYEAAREKLVRAPRGGGRSAAMTDAIFRQAQDVNNAFIGGRRMAADKMYGFGSQASGMGLGIANSGLGGAEGILGNMWGIDKDQAAAGAGFGSAMVGGADSLWNYIRNTDWYQNRWGTPGITGGPSGPGAGAGAGAGAGPAAGKVSPYTQPTGVFGNAILGATPQYSAESQPTMFKTAKLRNPYQKPNRAGYDDYEDVYGK